MDTTNSLAHTKWECKYHIVFVPKYRRWVIYKDIKVDVGQILGSLCCRKGIEIIEAECCPGSYSYAGADTTQIFSIKNSRIPERKKFPDNIREACEPEIKVWEQVFLV